MYFGGVVAGPVLNALHGGGIFGQGTLLDEHAADALIRLTVLVGIANAQSAAIRQLYPAGALDLQEEEFDRVIDPGQGAGVHAGWVSFDLLPCPVGNDFVVVGQAPADALAFELGEQVAEFNGQQVGRDAVDRIAGLAAGLLGTFEQRFVVAREQAVRGTVVLYQLIRLEVFLIVGTQRRRILSLAVAEGSGCVTGLLPGRFFTEGVATLQLCREGLGQGFVVGPAG